MDKIVWSKTLHFTHKEDRRDCDHRDTTQHIGTGLNSFLSPIARITLKRDLILFTVNNSKVKGRRRRPSMGVCNMSFRVVQKVEDAVGGCSLQHRHEFGSYSDHRNGYNLVRSSLYSE